jgi:uncharacterized protein
LTEADIDTLQSLLDQVPAPLDPLDATMLDGFLCGVLLQPNAVPANRWLPFVTDTEGRALPARFNAERLHDLALRRHAELNRAIATRQWFDPWVFELSPEDEPEAEDLDEDDPGGATGSEAVYPWVAGFATAMEHFPALMAYDELVLIEPLSLLYRHLDADDLEDADALLAEIESLEPPATLTDAVEELVRATLLLADITRPVRADLMPGAKPASRGPIRGPARRPPRGR